ncbi:MAG TPA: hypothetical protein VG962_02135 [Steroidobacteraceae bacterium]|nr:hypothetical protein [Steroidobacteraceae bacterium]
MNRVGDTLIHCSANEDLVRRLIDAQVEFVVIGGLAIAWHCQTRQADDMDLLVNPSEENADRIAIVLEELGLEGSSDVFVSLGRQVTLKQFHYAELLTPEKDGPQFAEISSTAVLGKLFGMSVQIASVESLINLKRRALDAANTQRQKHLADLELLNNVV